MRRLLLALSIGAVLATTVALPATAQVPPTDQLQYQVRTVYQGQERFTNAVAFVPTPVDVNGDLTPDVLVEVVALPGTPATPSALRADISRLATAPAGALGVEAVFAIATAAGRNRAAFGYSAPSGAPESFSATALISGAGISLQLNTSTAAPNLGIVGSLYRAAGDGRADAKSAHLHFQPMPATLTASFTTGYHDAAVEITSDAATSVNVTVDDVLGGHHLRATGLVDLPVGRTTVAFDTHPGREQVRYAGPGTINRLNADVRLIENGTLHAHVYGNLTGIQATELTLVKDGPHHINLAMNAPIQRVELGVGLRRPVELMQTGDDYLKVVIPAPDRMSIAAAVTGLSGGDFTFSNAIRIRLQKAKRPFRVEAFGLPGKPDLRGWVQVNDLPGTIDLTVSPNSTQLMSWNASEPIGRLETNLSDTAPLFGRVSVIKALATGIPAAMTLTTLPAGAGFDLSANGAKIDSLEAVFSSSDSASNERVPAGALGILVRDTPHVYNIALRIHALRRARAVFTPGCTHVPSDCVSGADAIVETTGGHTVNVYVRSLKPNGSEEATDFTVNSIPSTASFSMRDRILRLWLPIVGNVAISVKRDISYRGSTTGGGFAFYTNSGPRVSLWGGISPLPASVDICTAWDHACRLGSSGPANKGSMSYSASSHATLDLVDCGTSNCHSVNKTGVYTHIRNLYLRKLAFELQTNSVGAGNTFGRAVLDTDGYEMRGDVLLRGSDEKRTELFFGPGFWAQDRGVTWDVQVPIRFNSTKTGAMHCSPGTGFYVPTVLDILINVGGFIC